MIGDFLYLLSDMEARSAPVLQRFMNFVQFSDAAVVVDADSPAVPADKYLLLQNVVGVPTPGGAQTIVQSHLLIIDAIGTTLLILDRSPAGVGQLRLNGNQVLLAPGERIRFTSQFSAGAVANTCSVHVIGIFLPKGNLQLR